MSIIPLSLGREESGVLGFPSRRGLTPRGSLECNPDEEAEVERFYEDLQDLLELPLPATASQGKSPVPP